ncbi:hypothetical protein DFH06DRAFT_1345120 [Mycena polygramma]|nr:hypothetical protein DFH06DRAFT_1345120 [Mycena polygramma]
MDTLVDDVLDQLISHTIGDVNDWECAVFSRRAVLGVCKRWANRVTTNPAYWKKIWLYRFTPRDSAQFCLTNSDGHANILYVNSNSYKSMRNPLRPGTIRRVKCRPLDQHIQLLDDLLRGNMQHVNKLIIVAETMEHWVDIARALPVPTPCLVTKIVGTARTMDANYTVGGAHMAAAPGQDGHWKSVTTMVLNGVHPLWASPAIVPNLTHLSMGNVKGLTAAHLLQGLRLAPSLIVLKLQGVVCDRSDTSQNIVMNCLTDFSVVYDEDEGVHVLQYISMPAIRRMQVELWDDATLDALINVASTLLSTIAEVDIAVGGMAHGNLPWMLGAMENIEVVDIRRSGSGCLDAVRIAAQWNTRLMQRLRILKVLDEVDAMEAATVFQALPRFPPIQLITGAGDPQTLDEYVEWRHTEQGVEGHTIQDESEGVLMRLPNFVRV